ncbi:hypothetical protein AGIG_G24474 [Arapaima gigas]
MAPSAVTHIFALRCATPAASKEANKFKQTPSEPSEGRRSPGFRNFLQMNSVSQRYLRRGQWRPTCGCETEVELRFQWRPAWPWRPSSG